MNRFETQETIVGNFISALNAAGMQASYGNANKYRYWRGYVPKKYSNDALYLKYSVDFNDTSLYANDEDFMRGIQIGGEVYTINGFGDSQYQDLCQEIENQLKLKGFDIEWEGEDINTFFNADNPISFKRFTVKTNTI